MGTRIAWFVMTVLALFTAVYAFGTIAVLDEHGGFLADQMRTRAWAVYGHLLGGGVALVLGAFQLSARLRDSWMNAHRWMGRAYVLACAVGGVSGLALALNASGGIVGRTGFGCLGVAWLVSTWQGLARVRAGDVGGHRAWMIRSYALTFAAVTLRFYIPLSLICGVPFEHAYPAIAWACWVPNALFSQWWLSRARRAPRPPTPRG